MYKSSSEGSTFGATSSQEEFDHLMETDNDNPAGGMLKQLNIVDDNDGSDSVLAEFGLDEYIPFPIPEARPSSSRSLCNTNTNTNESQIREPILIERVPEDLDFVNNFSDAHMALLPFNRNLDGSALGDSGLKMQLKRGAGLSISNESSPISKSMEVSNGVKQISNNENFVLNSGILSGVPDVGVEAVHSNGVHLTYSELLALCKKQEKCLSKKQAKSLKMREMLVESSVTILNIRKKRDESVLDLKRCKEEYMKLEAEHQQLKQDNEKLKSEVTSGKLIIQQLGAKVSNLLLDNKALQAQLKNNSDPEKIRLKDEIKELSKLLKRNEKTIDNKTDTIENLRNTLASAQALAEVMKNSANNKNFFKCNDLVSVPNSAMELAFDQKPVEDIKHMITELRTDVHSIMKNFSGNFPVVKTKTKSMFDISDTDSERTNIRSCTSSTPSYDDDIFEDNFVPSVPSPCTPFSEDLVVSTIETEALSRGDYAKTTVNLNLEKLEHKNSDISATLDDVNRTDVVDQKPFLTSQNFSQLPDLTNENLLDAEYYDNCDNSVVETVLPPCTSPKQQPVSNQLKTPENPQDLNKSDQVRCSAPLIAKAQIELEEAGRSRLCGSSDVSQTAHVEVIALKNEPLPLQKDSTVKTFLSPKAAHISLSDSDTDDSASNSRSPTAVGKHRTRSKFSPIGTETAATSKANNSVSTSKSVQEGKCVSEKYDSKAKATSENHKSDGDEYYTDSDGSDSDSDEDIMDDSESSISSSEDEKEDLSSSIKPTIPSDPVAKSNSIILKNVSSTISPVPGFSLSDDLNLSSDESDSSEGETESSASVLFPASPCNNELLIATKLPELDSDLQVCPSSQNLNVSDVHTESVQALSDAEQNPVEKETRMEIVEESEELQTCNNSIDASNEKIPADAEQVNSPISSPEERQCTVPETSIDKTVKVTTSFKKPSVGKKDLLGDRKPAFLRRLVSKASSDLNNVDIPSRTPTLPTIFRRQGPLEVFGIKRPLSLATSKDSSKAGNLQPEVEDINGRTEYEVPAKKIRVSLFDGSRSKSVVTDPKPVKTVDTNEEFKGKKKLNAVSAVPKHKVANMSAVPAEPQGTITSVSAFKPKEKASKVSDDAVVPKDKMVKVSPIPTLVKDKVSKVSVAPVVPKETVATKGTKLPRIEAQVVSVTQPNMATKSMEIIPPAGVRMSAKDRIKNSMTDIIQVGSGENMCDKKKLELKAQKTIERMKAEKKLLQDSSSKEPVPVLSIPTTSHPPVVCERVLRTTTDEKNEEEAFMKTAPLRSLRRMPVLRPEPVAGSEPRTCTRVTRNSINKDKLPLVRPQVPTRTSPRKKNQAKDSLLAEISPRKETQRTRKEAVSNNVSAVCSPPLESPSCLSFSVSNSKKVSEDDIFREMFQELAKKSNISNNSCNSISSGSPLVSENTSGEKAPKTTKKVIPPQNVNLLKLMVGKYSRSLTTDEVMSNIQKRLPELTENPPSERVVAKKIYSDLLESVDSYLLKKIDEHALLVGCKKLCSTIAGVKSLLPNLYSTLDVITVTHFSTQILGRLSYRFDRNDVLNMLGLCYGTICREFAFRELAFQMLYLVLVKRVRQKSCFAQGFVSGYPDMWSFPLDRGSILEKSIVIALTCGPQYCDSIYYKDVRQLFIEGIGLELPDSNFKQLFSDIVDNFKELEFQKSIEDGEKALVMLLLQCDWQQSIQIIEENFNSIYEEWKENKLSDMIFNAFLRMMVWASEITTDPNPQFASIQAIFGRLKDSHAHGCQMMKPLSQFIEDGFVKLGKLIQRGPHTNPELVYFRLSDLAEHAKKKEKMEHTESRRIKRKIRRKDGRLKRKPKTKVKAD